MELPRCWPCWCLIPFGKRVFRAADAEEPDLRGAVRRATGLRGARFAPDYESHGRCQIERVGPVGAAAGTGWVREELCTEPDGPRDERFFPLHGMDSGDQQRICGRLFR